jgi:hypothetical protein
VWSSIICQRTQGGLLCLLLGLAGCQGTEQQMLSQGYPPAFVEGFTHGCGSGRSAAGESGEFHKDVPRYLQDAEYESGWDDGFRQCQAQANSEHEDNWQTSRQRESEP